MLNKLSLSDGEWKLMNLLWDESPPTIGGMVDALRDDAVLRSRTTDGGLHILSHLPS